MFGGPAGALDLRSWGRGLAPRLLLVFACLTSSAGCDAERSPPERLLDGSPVRAPIVELAGVDQPLIATKVELVATSEVGSCAGSKRTELPPGPAVRRVGVSGTSMTFLASSGDALFACESAVRAAEPGSGTWCGHAYGRISNGHLTDPRLDLTCLDADRDPVAFAWLEPSDDTRFVAVRQPGYVEVYEVSGDLPVRATTTAVAESDSAATFDVSEHDRRGGLLRAYVLEARVAG